MTDKTPKVTTHGTLPLLAGPDPDGEVWAEVTLLPIVGGPPSHGVITHWTGTSAAVRVTLGVARQLDGTRVWLSAHTHEGHLVLLRGTAGRAPQRRDELDVADLVHLATEARRASLRAPVEHPVLLVQEGTRTRATTTVDLSAAGCRVRRLPEHRLRTGQQLRAAIDVDSGPAIWASSQVVRVDEDAGEIALHFLEVSEADRERLDRDVLVYLTAQATG